MNKPTNEISIGKETLTPICRCITRNKEGNIYSTETLAQDPEGDLFLVKEMADPSSDNTGEEPKMTGTICTPISVHSAITWIAKSFPPEYFRWIIESNLVFSSDQLLPSDNDLIKSLGAYKDPDETVTETEGSNDDTPFLQFRFSNMRLEIIYDGNVYSYKNEEDLRSALFYAALSIGEYRTVKDAADKEMVLQRIEQALSYESIYKQTFIYDPEDLPSSFFSELMRTILITMDDEFTRTFLEDDLPIHIDNLFSFDPATGRAYPFLPIIRGFEDGLYFTVRNVNDNKADENTSKEDAFAYFLDTDGYPYWADLCNGVNDAVTLHRMFFDMHYDEYKKNYGRKSA